MPTDTAAAPSVHRSDSLRDPSKRVSFQSGVDVRRIGSSSPRRRRASPPVVIYRQQPPSSEAEQERQAEDIIRRLDSIECDVSPRPFPVRTPLFHHASSQPPVAGGEDSGGGHGSLGRSALKQPKNNHQLDLRSSGFSTLPSSSHKNTDIESDKNNLIKAESLRRVKSGALDAIDSDRFAKRTGDSVEKLNNINILRKGDLGDYFKRTEPDSLSGLVITKERKRLASGEFSPDKLTHGFSLKSPAPSPERRLRNVRDDYSSHGKPLKKAPSSEDVVYTEVMVDKNTNFSRNRFSPNPPTLPERLKSPYTPRGFSYISQKDADAFDRPDSVAERSRYIIEQIARDRSRSPEQKAPWSPQRLREYSRTPSPPPRPVPPLPPLRLVHNGGAHDASQSRHGSSIVMISGQKIPEIFSRQNNVRSKDERPAPSRRGPGHVYSPARGNMMYSKPREPNGTSTRPSDNVIRLSVSGSHSSSNNGSSPNEARRVHRYVEDTQDRRSFSHDPLPPPMRSLSRPNYDSRSQSSSPERQVFHHVVSRTSDSERPRRFHKSSTEIQYNPRGDELDGHEISRVSRNGRSYDPLPATADKATDTRRADRKKKIKIKFTYDDTKDEPSDVRLAKYVEYHGNGSTSLPPELRGVEGEGPGTNRRAQRQKEKFLTQFLEDERPERSERRDGRKIPPRRQSYDNHGIWSSFDEEDGRNSGGHRSQGQSDIRPFREGRVTTRNNLQDNKKKLRASVSSDEGCRVYKMQLSNESSASPEREERPKKKGWLSSTLSKLDLRSRRGAGSRSPSRTRGKSETRNGNTSDYSSGEYRHRSVPGENEEHRHRSGTGGSVDSRQLPETSGTGESRHRFGAVQSGEGRQRSGTGESGGFRPRLGTGESGESRTRSGTAQSGAYRHRSGTGDSGISRPRPGTAQSGDRHRITIGNGELRQRPAAADSRSASRESRSGSREPYHRRPLSRTPSVSQQLQHETDSPPGSGDSSTRRAARRPSNAAVVRSGSEASSRHHPKSPRRAPTISMTSSVNSSESEAGSQAGRARANTGSSRVSNGSNRSVYLHATTVADIPSPDREDPPTRSRSGSRNALDPAGALPNRERRKVARSFSLIGPFRPKHPTREQEISYENSTGQASGRPPKHPQHRPRSKSARDPPPSETSVRTTPKPRKPVSRSISMPRDSRPAGWFRDKHKTTR